MKTLEYCGLIVAVAAVIFAAVNGGMDVTSAIAFAPVAILATLQYAPNKGVWQFARSVTLAASLLGAALAGIVLGTYAGIAYDMLPTPIVAGYATAALCGFVAFAGLLTGVEEVMHTGAYR